MKTSEMIAMLEKNPKLEFTRGNCTFGYGGSLHLENGRLYGKSGDEYPFVLDGKNMPMDDWQLVREPVTWQEAIQAWIDGKEIEVCECAGCETVDGHKCGTHSKQTLNGSGKNLCRQQFKTAKWYIDD